MSEFMVRGAQFSDDGVELTFMRFPDDARADGDYVLTRSLFVSAKSALSQQVEELMQCATDLALDAYHAHDNAQVWQLPLEGDDEQHDEERGMGF